jgi:hypothetical protein
MLMGAFMRKVSDVNEYKQLRIPIPAGLIARESRYVRISDRRERFPNAFVIRFWRAWTHRSALCADGVWQAGAATFRLVTNCLTASSKQSGALSSTKCGASSARTNST